MATSAFTAKERVYTILDATLSPEGVQVTWGGVKSPQRSWAALGAVTYSESDWAAVGARGRSEDYDIAVLVNVILPGGSPRDAEAKTLAFVDAFETALRADPTLGGLAAKGAALVPREFKSQPVTDGSEGDWQGVVRISGARI